MESESFGVWRDEEGLLVPVLAAGDVGHASHDLTGVACGAKSGASSVAIYLRRFTGQPGGGPEEKQIPSRVFPKDHDGGDRQPSPTWRPWSVSRRWFESLSGDPHTCLECNFASVGQQRQCGHLYLDRLDGQCAVVEPPGKVRAVCRSECSHPLLIDVRPLTSDDEKALCRVLAMLDDWSRQEVPVQEGGTVQ